MLARLPAIVCAVAMLLGALPSHATAQAAAAGKPAAGTEVADEQAAETIALMSKAVEARDVAGVTAQLKRYEELWRKLSPKLVKKVTTSVVAMFKDFAPRDDYDIDQPLPGDLEQRVEYKGNEDLLDAYRLAAGVLYDKPEGRSILLSVLKIPHVRSWPEAVATMVEGLGYQPDAGLTAVVKPYLDDPSVVICGAAAKALAQLHDCKIEIRREAVAALVKAYSAAQVDADKERRRAKPADGEDGETPPTPAADRLELMGVPFGLSLQKLTRKSFPDPQAWQEWFDQHGKEPSW